MKQLLLLLFLIGNCNANPYYIRRHSIAALGGGICKKPVFRELNPERVARNRLEFCCSAGSSRACACMLEEFKMLEGLEVIDLNALIKLSEKRIARLRECYNVTSLFLDQAYGAEKEVYLAQVFRLNEVIKRHKALNDYLGHLQSSFPISPASLISRTPSPA